MGPGTVVAVNTPAGRFLTGVAAMRLGPSGGRHRAESGPPQPTTANDNRAGQIGGCGGGRRSARLPHENWSYVCANEDCCPAEGVPFDAVPDPAEAEALAVVGGTVLASRAALTARVAPLGGLARESMSQATRRAERHIAQLLTKVRKSSRLSAARHMIVAEGLAAVGAMIARYRDGGRFATVEDNTAAQKDRRGTAVGWPQRRRRYRRVPPQRPGDRVGVAHPRIIVNVAERVRRQATIRHSAKEVNAIEFPIAALPK